jgi:hypothetical protein
VSIASTEILELPIERAIEIIRPLWVSASITCRLQYQARLLLVEVGPMAPSHCRRLPVSAYECSSSCHNTAESGISPI